MEVEVEEAYFLSFYAGTIHRFFLKMLRFFIQLGIYQQLLTSKMEITPKLTTGRT
jgi:hypothetical protein